MSRPAKTTYKTTNWHSYNQALRQRGSLTVWFDPSMQWEAAPSGRRGRQQAYSDAAIQACLTIKVLLGLPLRQTTGFVASLLELSGLGWAVPDFSTQSRRQKTLGTFCVPAAAINRHAHPRPSPSDASARAGSLRCPRRRSTAALLMIGPLR